MIGAAAVPVNRQRPAANQHELGSRFGERLEHVAEINLQLDLGHA